ncbi:esterase-like activity of phytase-domain-containing protein [Xylariales sp. PMI_506]|nr:esterase-like activity of phytase-domain-containing protein [Xylariales sp. PMI_506]
MAALLATAALIATVAGRIAVPRGDSNSTTASTGAVNTTVCSGKEYVYEELAGYGYIVSNATDKYGDTVGGIGSAIHLEKSSWKKTCNGSYIGTLWTLPDRGWNTEGTLNFQSRVHKWRITFTPAPNATLDSPSPPNLLFQYQDTVLFKGPDGTPTTGLDADYTNHSSFPGFPDLPIAHYTGDGFGGSGSGGARIPVDAEGLVVNNDGSFWVSDEYGPYIYLFGQDGTMLTAIRPPEALVPYRNGTESFNAASPPEYIDDGNGPVINPEDPDSGRENNHGFEGLSLSEDGKTLWVLLQAATVQEGGLNSQTQRYTRFLKYDVSNPRSPTYEAEWIVPLPAWVDPTAKASKNPKYAAQSELHALPNGQFLILARDSNAGHGQSSSLSIYRQIDVFDVSAATNLKANGTFDCETCAAASDDGVLLDGVVPAEYCPWLDYNDNDQLGRFGMHNGGDQDAYLLNEKWESIAIVPVDPKDPGDEYFIFSLSDNDFITQDGHLNFGQFNYTDSSGYNLDNQALVFKVKIPQ